MGLRLPTRPWEVFSMQARRYGIIADRWYTTTEIACICRILKIRVPEKFENFGNYGINVALTIDRKNEFTEIVAAVQLQQVG